MMPMAPMAAAMWMLPGAAGKAWAFSSTSASKPDTCRACQTRLKACLEGTEVKGSAALYISVRVDVL